MWPVCPVPLFLYFTFTSEDLAVTPQAEWDPLTEKHSKLGNHWVHVASCSMFNVSPESLSLNGQLKTVQFFDQTNCQRTQTFSGEISAPNTYINFHNVDLKCSKLTTTWISYCVFLRRRCCRGNEGFKVTCRGLCFLTPYFHITNRQKSRGTFELLINPNGDTNIKCCNSFLGESHQQWLWCFHASVLWGISANITMKRTTAAIHQCFWAVSYLPQQRPLMYVASVPHQRREISWWT